MKKVEVLVVDGCPNVETTLEEIRAAIRSTREAADVTVVRVESHAAAEGLRFIGSPTVRVDGVDIEPSASDRDDYGLQCRLYSMDGRLRGAPPADWIAVALLTTAPPADASSAGVNVDGQPQRCCPCELGAHPTAPQPQAAPTRGET